MSNGLDSITERAPRKYDTENVAVCNDGDKFFITIGGSNSQNQPLKQAEKHDI